jgi:hypothetical protein
MKKNNKTKASRALKKGMKDNKRKNSVKSKIHFSVKHKKNKFSAKAQQMLEEYVTKMELDKTVKEESDDKPST